MINLIKFLKLLENIPPQLNQTIANLSMSDLYQNMSFISCLENLIDQYFAFTNSEYKEAEKLLPFVYSILAVALLSDNTIESVSVQSAVDSVYKCLKGLFTEEDGDPLSEIELLGILSDTVVLFWLLFR